ncbi:MAG: hypothetical protein ACOYME_12745 [Prochlorotrichaceae cyanobacterium]|jgi:flagellar biosynthesis/type III secretory pathway protein FliH
MQTIENRLITLKQIIQQLSVSDRWVLLKWLIELLQQEPQSTEKVKPQINLDAVRQICHEFRNLPILDSRSPDEIIGYNEFGGLDS